MIQNVIRLAELLQKEKISRAEKREGINLAHAMFGSTSHAHGDRVMVAFRRKKVTNAADPLSLVRKEQATHTTIGVKPDLVPTEQPDDLEPGQFKYEDNIYAEATDKANRKYYTKDGKRIGKAEFEAAQRAAAGVPDLDES